MLTTPLTGEKDLGDLVSERLVGLELWKRRSSLDEEKETHTLLNLFVSRRHTLGNCGNGRKKWWFQE